MTTGSSGNRSARNPGQTGRGFLLRTVADRETLRTQRRREVVPVDSTAGYTLSPTTHALKTIISKGFDGDTVRRTFDAPTEVYASRSHPGQYRVCGNGLCLVGKPEGGRFILITVYLDRVVTAVRPDQLRTAEGRRFAKVGRQR